MCFACREVHIFFMKIRVAIVGFGFMGQMHARVYQALPGIEIAGIIDDFPETKAQAARLGIKAPVAPSLESLLKSTDFNAVDICLPTDLHGEAIIAAARAGKHIFCEKPLALEIAEAEQALREVEKSGVALQVGQCIRFWPEYQALEQFIKSGRGGKLLSLSLQRRAARPAYSRDNWLHEARRSKGAALDLHIHDTDYVLHLLGKPTGVHSIGRREKGALSHIFTHYLFDNVAVTAEGGWDLPPQWGFQMSFQAIFEDAAVDFDTLSAPTLHLTLGAGKREPMPFAKPAAASAADSGGNISDLGGYYNELAYFCEQLSQGKKPQIATGPQALESLRTVLAEIQSASQKKIVVL
jgi:predicted dehydrogenase